MIKYLALVVIAIGVLSGCKVAYTSDGTGPIFSIDPDFKDQAGVQLVYEEQSIDPDWQFMRTISGLSCETDRAQVPTLSVATLIDRSDSQAREDLRIKAGRANADVLKFQSCNGQPRGERTGCTQCVGSLYTRTKAEG
ncbi:hypothetical protein [Umboniibacter marinipuniceus]|uniref:Lipoprotein n=1 Tax=Umboniibacter marinipuniceus TaxID=569599 RepID=A0A3M0AEX8_9GAMM|nr:hypothetical protein [Umboniibacter marinipuniceus]RMA81308.1 hypothetical protein DFR27_1125 [Umboniibacter marinipuniceus]